MNNVVRKLLKSLMLFIMVAVLLISTPISAADSNIVNADIIDQLYEWLLNTQLSNGALSVYAPDSNEAAINPYFASIATLAILKHPDKNKGLETVERYYDWHFDHLNDDGSIYDYDAVIENKEIISENSKADYDSADSYAALFLISLWEYIQAGGSREYILKNEDNIYLIIDLMTSLIDRKGLSKVSSTNETIYLMDNCEVYAGLHSAAKILENVMIRQHGMFTGEYWNIRKQIINLKYAKYKMKTAIEINLWNNDTGCYHVGINSNNTIIEANACDDLYPDAVAQIFPIVFGIISPNSQRAKNIYNAFSKEFEWENLSHYYEDKTSFYWGIAAFCGSMMDDADRVEQYIQSLHAAEEPNYNYPLYNADAAWVILAWEHLN